MRANDPAYPSLRKTEDIGGNVLLHDNYDGLTKLELFSINSLQGLLVNMGSIGYGRSAHKSLASEAVMYAKALIAELENEPKA